MAQYNDLSRESKLLANGIFSAIEKANTPTDRMQAIIDEIAEVDKKNDPEYQEFLRLQKKFPQG